MERSKKIAAASKIKRVVSGKIARGKHQRYLRLLDLQRRCKEQQERQLSSELSAVSAAMHLLAEGIDRLRAKTRVSASCRPETLPREHTSTMPEGRPDVRADSWQGSSLLMQQKHSRTCAGLAKFLRQDLGEKRQQLKSLHQARSATQDELSQLRHFAEVTRSALTAHQESSENEATVELLIAKQGAADVLAAD